DDNASRRLELIAVELAKPQAHETDLDHLTLDVPEGPLEADPIAHADAVRGHHGKVSDQGQNDGLESKRNAGRGKSEPGDEHGEFAGEVGDQPERDGYRHDDIARHEEEAPTVRVVHVTTDRHTPQNAADQDRRHRDGDPDEPDAEALHD